MKLIVSANRLTAVNAEQVKKFSIELYESEDCEKFRFSINADGVPLSYYSTLSKAVETLQKSIGALAFENGDGNLILQMENIA